MLFSWLNVRLARVGLAITAIAITVLALMPAKEVPATSGWDKLDHWSAFFTLSFLACHVFPRKPFWQLALMLVGYGIGIEVVQSFTPDRDADVMDVVADSIGVLIYGLVVVLSQIFAKSHVSTKSSTE